MRALPAPLAEVLRPVLPGLSDEIVEAIGREVEDYARPLEGPFGRAVRRGVERALSRFLDLAVAPPTERSADREIYVELGRGEFRQGRSLDALLAAYRLGARLAWRRFVDAGREAGVDPEVLYDLGEAIFAYIDGLSAESIEGYAEAQSAAAGERQRRRRRLLALLEQEPPADAHALQAAAERAGWPLPGELAALAVSGAPTGRLAARLGSEVLLAERDDLVLALVPDPRGPGRRARLERALAGALAALGPAVAPADTHTSVARAVRTHRLLTEGLVPGPFVASDDHLARLAVHADPALARDLAAAVLAPLAGLPPSPRAKLGRTLRVWLDHRGRVEEVARELGVHAQTVRYRLNQLRDLYGQRLEDPEERFALGLALRAGRDI